MFVNEINVIFTNATEDILLLQLFFYKGSVLFLPAGKLFELFPEDFFANATLFFYKGSVLFLAAGKLLRNYEFC